MIWNLEFPPELLLGGKKKISLITVTEGTDNEKIRPDCFVYYILFSSQLGEAVFPAS